MKQHFKSNATMDNKRSRVLAVLERNIAGSDLQFSLLVAACSSYRQDTVLRPFPPNYTDKDHNEIKEYERLDKDINRIPDFKKASNAVLDSDLTDLLHWCLCHDRYSMSLCEPDQFHTIEHLTGHTDRVPAPTHIFEVTYCETLNDRFERRRDKRNVFHAYHGSRLENFHCILHYGLQGHMNKNSLFGEGTYLSSELSVSMPYAPSGSGWKESTIGDKMSCIAVCEIIDDPSSVKCQEKNRDDPTTSRNRSRIANSIGGEIPEKYYVVRNNDLIRVKYLLLYAQKLRNESNFRQSWVFQHKFLVLVIVYALLLVVIGFYNSRYSLPLKKYLKGNA